MEVGESMNNGNYTNCCGACCPEVSCTLSQNVDVLEPCDIITYTATCINNDPLVTNAFFRDCLPAPLVFIPGTLYINGVNYPTLSPENGCQSRLRHLVIPLPLPIWQEHMEIVVVV